MPRDRLGAARKRPFRHRKVDPAEAHQRSVHAARARLTPEYHIRKLTEAAATLTAEQRRQLAVLLVGPAPEMPGDGA
jgi:hypothetical protein